MVEKQQGTGCVCASDIGAFDVRPVNAMTVLDRCGVVSGS
jgi:hypothetical protein